MVRIGLLGAGHLGKIHLQCLQALPQFHVTGFFDTDPAVSREVSEKFGLKAFSSSEQLVENSDAVDIVTTTSTHYGLAKLAINSGKHVFIEKPVTSELHEAKELIGLAEKKGVKVQVGHVERFNPAMLAIKDMILEPRFIEVHRLAPFNPRGTEVSVVLDLMIHDLDILLNLNPTPVARIFANGVSIVSNSPDIANARIEWNNGCVANVTASRISLKNMRKMRLFQNDAYVGIDFLEKTTQIISLVELPDHDQDHSNDGFILDTPKGKRKVHVELPEVKSGNAIQIELTHFYKAVTEDGDPVVSLKEACNALELAHRISESINESSRNIDVQAS
jgi:predicted dehydrogenase